MIRLTEKEIKEICRVFHQIFSPNDKLWIFGSRVNPDERGGDIDLYIETYCSDANVALSMKLNFLYALKSAIGDQKIDVIVKFDESTLPIYEIARQEGIRLV